jgi:hypothetical protein
MISSAMHEEAKEKAKQEHEKTIHRLRKDTAISESQRERNLSNLIGAFEHYMGKEPCEKLEPEYAVAGRGGIVHLKAEDKNFELEVEDLEDKEFLKKAHPLYVVESDGREIERLATVAFDEKLKTKVLAAIGRYLGKVAAQ